MLGKSNWRVFNRRNWCEPVFDKLLGVKNGNTLSGTNKTKNQGLAECGHEWLAMAWRNEIKVQWGERKEVEYDFVLRSSLPTCCSLDQRSRCSVVHDPNQRHEKNGAPFFF
jgi:hypothetical protein